MRLIKRLINIMIIVLIGQVTVGVALAEPTSAQASVTLENIDPVKLELIKELISVTGASASSEQYATAFSQQLISILRISNPDLSASAMKIANEEVVKSVKSAFASESLQQQIYPIYAQHFSVSELKDLIAFNQSPTGRKANQVMPQLMAESIDAAQNWSKIITPRISRQVLKRFSQEGIEVNLQPPSP